MRSFDDTTARFTFDSAVPLDEVEGTLELSRLAAGILHGLERVEIEAPGTVDRDSRTVVITTTTETGRTLASLFYGYCRREFGRKAVCIDATPAQIAGAA